MEAINLPSKLVEAISRYTGIEKAVFQRIIDKVHAHKGVLFPEVWEQIVSDQSVADLNSFEKVALGVVSYICETGITNKDEFHNELRGNVLSFSGAKSDDKVDSIKEIVDILFSKKLVLTLKLAELSYNHPDTIRKNNIIIDARPIFDVEQESVATYSILAFLKLDLMRHSEPELLSLYLSRSDIVDLQASCKKALEKIDQVARQLADATGGSVYIPGNSDEAL